MAMKKFVVQQGETLGYILYLPEGVPTEKLPLMVYLHGAGERGTKLENLYRHAIPKLIEEGREYQAVVLCPQCPADSVWDNVTVRVKNTIDKVVQEYGIKKDRIVCTGSSMGGFGTFMMGMTYRNFFAAIGPVAGGGMSWRVDNLKTTPVYAVHGDMDQAVPIEYSQRMVQKMQEYGMQPRFTILEGFGHNDGIEQAYRETFLTDWLLQQRRTDFSYVPEHLEEMF